MAASSVGAQRFSDDFSDDSADFAGSIDSEPRVQRKSTRTGAHKSNGGVKRCDGSKSKKEEQIGERSGGDDDSGGAVEDEVIKCLCASSVEKGEMVCCEICEGWSHLSCMGMKERVGLMEGKVFVCHFCVSAHMIALRKELGGLKEELNVVKSELKVVNEENERLKRQMEQGKPKGVEVMTQEVEATGGLIGDEMVNCDKSGWTLVVGERQKQKQKLCQHEPKGQRGNGRSHNNGRCMEPKKVSGKGSGKEKQSAVPKKAQKNERANKRTSGSPPRTQQFVGRRKLWGTKRMDTEGEVKAFLVSRVPEAASVEVKRVFKSEEGRFRWWFWLTGDESVLKLVDGGSFGEFWKVEKKSPFLESVAVRVLPR